MIGYCLTATGGHFAHGHSGADDPQPDLRLLVCGPEDSRPPRSPAPCAWCSHGCQSAGQLIIYPCHGCCGCMHTLAWATDCYCVTTMALQTMTESYGIVCRCAQTLLPASSWRQFNSWSSAAGAALPGRERRAPTSRAPWLADAAACQVLPVFNDGSRHRDALTSACLTSFHRLVTDGDATCLPAERLGLSCRSLVVSGGVACNATVRSALQVQSIPHQPAGWPVRCRLVVSRHDAARKGGVDQHSSRLSVA